MAAPSASEAEKPRLYLIVDYLPNFVYPSEPLTFCARVENAGTTPQPAALHYALADSRGKTLWQGDQTAEVQPEKFWRVQETCRIPKKLSGELALRISLKHKGSALAQHCTRIIGRHAARPGLQTQGTHLEDEKGNWITFQIEQKVRQPDRKWIFARWVRGKVHRDTVKPESVVVIGSRLAAEASDTSYADLFLPGDGGKRAMRVAATTALGSGGTTYPVLQAAVTMCVHKLPRSPRIALVVLGTEDQRMGTGILEFRRAIELILQRLEKLGCKRTYLISPISPPHLAGEVSRYTAMLRTLAWVYRVQFIDVGSVLSPEHWRLKGEVKELFGAYPNLAGQKKIAEVIRAKIQESVDLSN